MEKNNNSIEKNFVNDWREQLNKFKAKLNNDFSKFSYLKENVNNEENKNKEMKKEKNENDNNNNNNNKDNTEKTIFEIKKKYENIIKNISKKEEKIEVNKNLEIKENLKLIQNKFNNNFNDNSKINNNDNIKDNNEIIQEINNNNQTNLLQTFNPLMNKNKINENKNNNLLNIINNEINTNENLENKNDDYDNNNNIDNDNDKNIKQVVYKKKQISYNNNNNLNVKNENENNENIFNQNEFDNKNDKNEIINDNENHNNQINENDNDNNNNKLIKSNELQNSIETPRINEIKNNDQKNIQIINNNNNNNNENNNNNNENYYSNIQKTENLKTETNNINNNNNIITTTDDKLTFDELFTASLSPDKNHSKNPQNHSKPSYFPSNLSNINPLPSTNHPSNIPTINNNINNINNNKNLDTSSFMSSIIENQIKKIDEKAQNELKKEEENLLKIREEESKLPFDQRLTSNNREIRKNAIKELSEMCLSDFNSSEEERKNFYECFNIWVKYIIEESNGYVLPECLNFFLIFNSIFPEYKENSFKDFIDNLERILNLGINNLNDLIIKIIFLFVDEKKYFNLMINELIKLINSNNLKVLKFLNEIFIELITNGYLNEYYIKIIFEKIIVMYFSINLKNIEKKKIFTKFINEIFAVIEDDTITIRKNIKNINSYKDFDNLFKNSKKNKIEGLKIKLYKHENNNIEHNNNNNNLNSERTNFSEQNVNDFNNNNNNIEKDYNYNKKDKNVSKTIVNEEINDIYNILPNDFFEYHFLTQFQEKLSILENANEILSQVKIIRDLDRNLIDFYKIINYSIEDSNILIHLEGIKLLKNLCRLFKNKLNENKLKLILNTTFDKFKDKKSLVKNEIFTLFNIIIDNDCLNTEIFIHFVLNFFLNKPKETTIVKTSLIEYLKILLKNNKRLNFISEKNYLNYSKLIINLIEKESVAGVKDLYIDLLIIFKKKIHNQNEFNKIIKNLPNYRKKVINSGVENDNLNSEGNYKRNLKRIKSSYSFNNNNKNGRSVSKNRNSNSMNKNLKTPNKNNNVVGSSENNIKNNTSSSTPKNNKLKNQLNKKISNDDLSKDNFDEDFNNNVNNIKVIKPESKLYKKNSFNNNNNNNLNESNNSINNNNQIYYDDYNNNITNNNNNNNDNFNNFNNNFNNKSNNNINNISNNNINTSISSKKEENAKEKLEHNKENLIENIQNLNINSIENYTKVLIRDFFSFVNKVCEGQVKNEDLSYHFEIIFSLILKILERTKTLELNDTENKIKLKKIRDDITNQSTKLLVIIPCINQINNSNKMENFDEIIQTILNYSINKEKFYIYILLNLYKFSFKDKEFPQNLDCKESVIYFLNFCKKGSDLLKSEKILTVINEFLKETVYLNEEEKQLININYNYNNNNNNNNEINNNNNNNSMSDIIKNDKNEIVQKFDDEEIPENFGSISKIEQANEDKYNKNTLLTDDNNNNKNYLNRSFNNNLDEDPEFLQKKIKEEEELIKQKCEENERLKAKIKEFEEKKKLEEKSLKINENNNNNNNNNVDINELIKKKHVKNKKKY